MEKALNSNLQKRKHSYNEEVLKIEQDMVKKNGIISEMQGTQEKLKKSKELLTELSGLVSKRSEKAKKIYTFINTGKDTDSLMEEVKNINNDIKEIQQSLKSMQDISESISVCLLEILGDDIKSAKIENVNEKIDKELDRISKGLVDALKASETNSVLRTKYLGYILCIDKFLDGLKLVDSVNGENTMESDLVYNYAKENGLNDIVEKMKLRKLSYGEYEDFLVKINPIYAYVVHMIDIANSDSEREIYYDLLEKVESGRVADNEKKSLQEKANQWLFYKCGDAGLVFDSFVQKSKEIREGVKYNIPDARDKKTSEMIEYMMQFVEDLDEKDINSNLVEELRRKGRGAIVERNGKFRNIRAEIERPNVMNETFGAFERYNEYEEFKSSHDHDSDEAMKFLESGKRDFVVHYLKYFKNLSDEVLNKMLDGDGRSGLQMIVENYKSFGVELDKFALKVLDSGFDPKLLFVVINNEKFGSEVAIKIINLGNDKENIKELFKDSVKKRRFGGLNSDVAILIMDQCGEEGIKYVATHLGYFEALNLEVWDRLSKSDYYWLCSRYRRAFDFDIENKSDTQSVIRSIDEGFGGKVIKNINNYKGLNYKEVINKLIEKGLGWCLAKNINKFSIQLHGYIARKLVDSGGGRYLAKNIINFSGLTDENLETLAFDLIKKEQGLALAVRLKGFKGINHQDVAKRLIDTGQGKYVAKFRNNFEGLDESIIRSLEEIVKEISKTSGKEIVSYFDLIPIKDKETIINLVNVCPGNVALHLRKFDKKYYKVIANELISINESKQIIKRFSNFGGLLDAEIANKLKEKGFGDFVEKHASEFKGYVNEHKNARNDAEKKVKEEDLRRFLASLSEETKEKSLSSTHTYRRNFEDLNAEFKKQYKSELPKSWGSLILALGGEKGCQKHDYLFALVKSRKDGARYFKKYGSQKQDEIIKEKSAEWREYDNYIRYIGLLDVGSIWLMMRYNDIWEKNKVNPRDIDEGLEKIKYEISNLECVKIDGKDVKCIPGKKLSNLVEDFAEKYIKTGKERMLFFRKLFENINNIAKKLDVIEEDTGELVENEDIDVMETFVEDDPLEELKTLFPESFVNLLNIKNGKIKREDLDNCFEQKKNNLEGYSLDDVYTLIEEVGLIIVGKDSENWDIKETYNINNLGRIQKFLSVRNGDWKSFKDIIGEGGEVKRNDLNAWIQEVGFEVKGDFEYKLSHFGIKIFDEEGVVDFGFETGKQFIEKLELLGFECGNREILIQNIDKALSKKGTIVVGLKSSLETTLEKLYHYRNSGSINEESPFDKITPTNGNPKFSVIKYRRGSGKVPRFIFSYDEKKVLAIMSHEDYDRLRKGTRRDKIELEGIESKIFW